MNNKEKGSVTLYVTIACIVLVAVLSLIAFNIMNRNNNQKKQLDEVSDNYSVSSNEMEQAYEDAGGDKTQHVTLEELEKLLEQTKEDVRKEMEEKYETQLNEFKTQLEETKKSAKLEAFPVGSIFITTDARNPGTYIGGTWTTYAEGRTLIGVGTSDQNFTVGSTGGGSTVTLAVSQMPSHTHSVTATGSVASKFTGTAVNTTSAGAHTHTLNGTLGVMGWPTNASNTWSFNASWTPCYPSIPTIKATGSAGAHTHSVTAAGTVTSTFTGTAATTTSVGGGGAHNNLPPYIVTYMWKRTA